MTFDSSQHDREIRDLKNKLSNEEKAHRSEMTHTRMRLENRIALLQEESQNTQTQLEKARRERDTLRCSSTFIHSTLFHFSNSNRYIHQRYAGRRPADDCNIKIGSQPQIRNRCYAISRGNQKKKKETPTTIQQFT